MSALVQPHQIQLALAKRQQLIVPAQKIVQPEPKLIIPEVVSNKVPMRTAVRGAYRHAHGRFNVVMMDPPWWYANRLTGKGRSKFGEGASGKYGCMTDAQLLAIGPKVIDVLADQAVVLMWVTGPRLDFAIEMGKAWGLHYSTIGFVWIKTTNEGDDERMLPGTYTSSNCELLLLFTYNRIKGDTKLTPEQAGGKRMVRQVYWDWVEKGDAPIYLPAPAPEWWDVNEYGPYLEPASNGATVAWPDGTIGVRHALMKHSQKPEVFQDRIEMMYPGCHKMEMFARRQRPDWACLGNEMDGLDINDALLLAAGGYYDIEQEEELVG